MQHFDKKTIERVGTSLKKCKEVVQNFDIEKDNFHTIGRHKEMFFEDVLKLWLKS